MLCFAALAIFTARCLLSCVDSSLPFFGAKTEVALAVPQEYYQGAAKNDIDSNTGAAYVLYTDFAMQTQTIKVEVNRQSLNVLLVKNRITPFLFYLDSSDSKPHGCIYPFSTQVNPAGGFTAFILYRISVLTEQSAQTVYSRVSRFNWQKLYDLVLAYDDPWILDDALIIEEIAKGTFTTRHVKKK